MVLEKGLLIPWFMGEYDITHPTHHLGHVARTILWSGNVKDTFRGKLDVFRQGVFGFDCFPSLIASIISTCLGRKQRCLGCLALVALESPICSPWQVAGTAGAVLSQRLPLHQ